MDSLAKLFGGWIIAVIVVSIINLALLAGAVWVVVKILQAMGVL
jgi:hypothetical protein